MAIISNSRIVVKFVWTHPSNQGHRVRALVRAIDFQVRGRVLRKPTLTTLGERSCVWARLHHSGTSKVVYANPPDHPEMLVWRRFLQPRDLFIDVGANAGSYTIWAAELGADVIALEPAADTFALLLENIALNGYRVETIQAAARPVLRDCPFYQRAGLRQSVGPQRQRPGHSRDSQHGDARLHHRRPHSGRDQGRCRGLRD